jgi:hypothetical protein
MLNMTAPIRILSSEDAKSINIYSRITVEQGDEESILQESWNTEDGHMFILKVGDRLNIDAISHPRTPESSISSPWKPQSSRSVRGLILVNKQLDALFFNVFISLSV